MKRGTDDQRWQGVGAAERAGDALADEEGGGDTDIVRGKPKKEGSRFGQ
jgi:hypothetical protein